MPRSLTVSDIEVTEVFIDKYGLSGGLKLTALYEWVDSGGQRVSHKRITIYPPGAGPQPEMPPAAQTKLQDLLTAIGNFIKQQDGIV